MRVDVKHLYSGEIEVQHLDGQRGYGKSAKIEIKL